MVVANGVSGGVIMLRQVLCSVLILTLVGQCGPALAGDVKRQLALIPADKKIEVKLKQKGSKRIIGRLGTVTDEGFEVQTVPSLFSLSEEPGKISTEKIAFADVESVKKRGMSLGAKIGIGAGVVGGIAFLKILSWLASD
jgi:hypothetical protein